MSGPDLQPSLDVLIEGLKRAEQDNREEGEHRRRSSVWRRSADEWTHKADGIKYAIDVLEGRERPLSEEGLENHRGWRRWPEQR